MAESKQYEPSRRRREQARIDGKVSKSQLLTQCAGLLGAALATPLVLRNSLVNNQMLLEYLWLDGWQEPLRALKLVGLELAWVVAGILVPAAVLATLIEVFQVGWSFTPRLLFPRVSRLDLAQGFARIVSGPGKGVWIAVKLVLLILFFSWFFSQYVVAALALLLSNASSMYAAFLAINRKLLMAGIGLLLVAGVGEWWWRRRRHHNELSMSLDEVRREHREQEGDPMLRALRRAEHGALARDALIQQVRKAAVVVVERQNPGEGG